PERAPQALPEEPRVLQDDESRLLPVLLREEPAEVELGGEALRRRFPHHEVPDGGHGTGTWPVVAAQRVERQESGPRSPSRPERRIQRHHRPAAGNQGGTSERIEFVDEGCALSRAAPCQDEEEPPSQGNCKRHGDRGERAPWPRHHRRLARQPRLRLLEGLAIAIPVGIVAPAALLLPYITRHPRHVLRERVQRLGRGVLGLPLGLSEEVVGVVLETLPADLAPGALGDFYA